MRKRFSAFAWRCRLRDSLRTANHAAGYPPGTLVHMDDVVRFLRDDGVVRTGDDMTAVFAATAAAAAPAKKKKNSEKQAASPNAQSKGSSSSSKAVSPRDSSPTAKTAAAAAATAAPVSSSASASMSNGGSTGVDASGGSVTLEKKLDVDEVVVWRTKSLSVVCVFKWSCFLPARFASSFISMPKAVLGSTFQCFSERTCLINVRVSGSCVDVAACINEIACASLCIACAVCLVAAGIYTCGCFCCGCCCCCCGCCGGGCNCYCWPAAAAVVAAKRYGPQFEALVTSRAACIARRRPLVHIPGGEFVRARGLVGTTTTTTKTTTITTTTTMTTTMTTTITNM
jgi:hypothetical protein